MKITKTDGLISAFFTPLNSDGSINLNAISGLIDRLVSDGLAGVFLGGTNGEGSSLTLEERIQVTETVIETSRRRLRTIVHVGHASIVEAQKLAKHAGECGADAMSAVATFYYKPSSPRNLVACMSEIACASPELPFYYYHIPAKTGLTIDPFEFMQLAERCIPNFAGIKFSAPELWEYQCCLNFRKGKYDVLYGVDENLLPALAIGSRGAIGSTYNFLAPLYLKVRTHFENGRIAKAQLIMSWLVDMVRIMDQFPAVPAQKAMMKMIGLDLGPCRLPLTQLSEKDYAQLKNDLEEINFFEYVSGIRTFG